METGQKYKYVYYENEKPKSLHQLAGSKPKDIRDEFDELENLFYNYKDGIKDYEQDFDKYNVWKDLLPIKETAVILNVYDEDGRKIT